MDGSDFEKIRRVLRRAKGQNLREVSQSVSRAFGWYRPNEELRETGAKALLRRLAKRGLIDLPQDSRRTAECRQGRRAGAGAQVMAALRNLAIGLFRCAGAKNMVAALRHCARHGEKALRLIGL